jgi:hypothetical protein
MKKGTIESKNGCFEAWVFLLWRTPKRRERSKNSWGMFESGLGFPPCRGTIRVTWPIVPLATGTEKSRWNARAHHHRRPFSIRRGGSENVPDSDIHFFMPASITPARGALLWLRYVRPLHLYRQHGVGEP